MVYHPHLNLKMEIKMLSNVQNIIEQAIKDQNRPVLLGLLSTIAEALKQVESPTSKAKNSLMSLSELQKEVREEAKNYITSRGAQGLKRLKDDITIPACGGEHKTLKDCNEQELKNILARLKDAKHG
ncbi:hypothetical protein [Candidatus Liberibacter brunswickensis]|uniref:hypothetical protein n=1 Tax=Candidatus Liberibacter brunswickensis TaxID=1968796 RepID=UPI002FE06A1C